MHGPVPHFALISVAALSINQFISGISP